ncbi:MAG: hypothetical protein JRF35_07870 [Deltaproteobacteria bacterium]|nr:hypothetical protein [Deltaproteobacteria bacterium]
MLDEKNDLGSPNGWLKRAKSNLIRAKQPKHEEEIKKTQLSLFIEFSNHKMLKYQREHEIG